MSSYHYFVDHRILLQILKMLKKMKKAPLQISMVCFAVISMVVINLFSLNISSMVLMLAAAVIGLMVFMIKNTEKEQVEK